LCYTGLTGASCEVKCVTGLTGGHWHLMFSRKKSLSRSSHLFNPHPPSDIKVLSLLWVYTKKWWVGRAWFLPEMYWWHDTVIGDIVGWGDYPYALCYFVTKMFICLVLFYCTYPFYLIVFIGV
jgi:hypothetical protein